jgi:hypothetical protein
MLIAEERTALEAELRSSDAFVLRRCQILLASARGVQIMPFPLAIKRPWLNPIEAKSVHGKRKVVEPDRLLSAREPAARVCAALACPYEAHLTRHDVLEFGA